MTLSTEAGRRVRKFWLAHALEPELMTRMALRLPASGSSEVASLYFDSDDFAIYRRCLPSSPRPAVLVRLRWYDRRGPVFAETKETAAGMDLKQRLKLDVGGSLAEAWENLDPAIPGHQAELEDFLARAGSVVGLARLRPKLFVRYRRQAFEATDGTIRLTLDSRLVMLRVLPRPGRPRFRACRFPGALFEMKLHGSSPEWLDALTAGLAPLPAFSKYAYGIGRLYEADAPRRSGDVPVTTIRE